jgi:hypothetical protein
MKFRNEEYGLPEETRKTTCSCVSVDLFRNPIRKEKKKKRQRWDGQRKTRDRRDTYGGASTQRCVIIRCFETICSLFKDRQSSDAAARCPGASAGYARRVGAYTKITAQAPRSHVPPRHALNAENRRVLLTASATPGGIASSRPNFRILVIRSDLGSCAHPCQTVPRPERPAQSRNS